MIPTSTPIRSTKRPFGQTLQTSDDIWAAAKAGRVESRPSPPRPDNTEGLSARLRAQALVSGKGGDSIAIVGGDGCPRQPLALPGDPIDLGEVLRRQRPPRGALVLLDLLRRGSAGDDAGDRAVAQQPAKRQLEHGAAPARGECLEFADDAPVALADELLGVAW